MSTPLGCDEKASRSNSDMVNVTDAGGITWKISNQNLFANLPISENPFDIDVLSAITTLEDADYFVILDDTDGQHKKISKAALENEISSGDGAMPYILLLDKKDPGVDGGTFNNGSWEIRDLNYEQEDTHNLCTLSSNQFTLLPGTYLIQATTPAYRVNRHQAMLYYETGSSPSSIGTPEYSSESTGYCVTRSIIRGVVTLESAGAFSIQHRCQTSRSDNGRGLASDFSQVETYTIVEIWRLAE